MLVKIISMGLPPAEWKVIFDKLRHFLPDQPFSVMLFSSLPEMKFLQDEYFPGQYKREGVNFLICHAGETGPTQEQLDFLRRIKALGGRNPATQALVLGSLEKGLKQLIERNAPLTVFLETKTGFTLSDPSLLLRGFPSKFPRIRVNDHVTSLQIKNREGVVEEVRAQGIANGRLVSFKEIEALHHDGKKWRPKDWLKNLFRVEGIKRPPRPAGLIREPKGLFLFPGLPLEKVRGVSFGGVLFSHLIDMKKLDVSSPQFSFLLATIKQEGEKQARAFLSAITRIRQAEAKADIPIVCGGKTPLLRESMAALLMERGHLRCFTLNAPGEGVFREPSLFLQLDSWEKGRLGPQADEPKVLDISGELEKPLKPLERLLPWREVSFKKPKGGNPDLTKEEFNKQSKRLISRDKKSTSGLDLEEKKNLLQKQDVQVLQAARKKLEELLEANDTIQIWDGQLDESVEQVLVFSHDREEAGAVLQALKKISKKRWFDLSPFTEPDSVQNLSLEEVKHYGDKGVMLITAASRERLLSLQGRIEKELPETERLYAESEAALQGFKKEIESVKKIKKNLARSWVWKILGNWVEDNSESFRRALEGLRDRHERRWLNRSQVRRALVIPSNVDNAGPLLDACAQVYPGFNRNLSTAIPYEYDLQDELPESATAAIIEEARSERLSQKGAEGRIEEALARHNEAMFADYLQVVSGDLRGVKVDLVLIEHRPDIAPRILHHLRNSHPQLKNIPVILVLSDYWSPPADKPMPWSHTRVVLLRRLGPVPAEECARQMRALYPM